MKSLKYLSDIEFEASFGNSVNLEREALHVVLRHICEAKRRHAHLRASAHMCRYLVETYKYTGGAAMRRIEAAKFLEEVPAIATKIEDGSLNLSQLGEVHRAVKEKERTTKTKVTTLQKEEIFAKVADMTVHETQKELAQTLDVQIKEYDSKRMQKDGSVRLEVTLTQTQYEKLIMCRDKASHTLSQRNKSFNLGEVFEIVMDQYLKMHNSPPKLDKKLKDEVKQANEFVDPKKDAKLKENSTLMPKRDNKTLTPKTRRLVLQRDGCCQFKDPKTGKICGTTFALTIDHKQSRWANGNHRPENLQAMCASHNQLKYRQESNLTFF